MLKLKNGETNTIYLNLERSTLNSDIYIFRIYSKETKEMRIFSVKDISETEYYKKFVITLTYNNEELNMSKVRIDNGEWSYSIYETDDLTTPFDEQLANTDTNCLHLLKAGIMIIEGDCKSEAVVSKLTTEEVVLRKNK